MEEAKKKKALCCRSIGNALSEMAKSRPDADAIICPAGEDNKGKTVYTRLSFRKLDKKSDSLAAGFLKKGIGPGIRTIVMIKPGIDFFIITFALFKAGAVLVFIDPGMGANNVKKCINSVAPQTFIGIPKAHFFRILMRWGTKTIRQCVWVGKPFFIFRTSIEKFYLKSNDENFIKENKIDGDDMAAILFTSGSTGVPKGAVYTNNIFLSQIKQIGKTFNILPGEIDLPTFPLFALFDTILGMTALIPDMDFANPARVDPKKIIDSIHRFKPSSMFASPAVVNKIARYGEELGITFPSLKRVICAGAPVSPDLQKRFCSLLKKGVLLYTPYGATEALPVSSISSKEILTDCIEKTEEGKGICVGYPLEEITVLIIKITDTPVLSWSDDLRVDDGIIGEIVVMGDVVTKGYYNNRSFSDLAKIPVLNKEGISTQFYHRMGDVGYFDEEGRLWFCGRKSHRVRSKNSTLFTIPCEGVLNTHKDVFRTALIGIEKNGNKCKIPAICVELNEGVEKRRFFAITQELGIIAQKFPHTKEITTFFHFRQFPVDKRHNAKIGREKLAVWAQKKEYLVW